MKAFFFFRNLSWLLALNLLIKPVWIFVIDRRVQNIVGHETYGRYFALFNLTYVLLFLADAGLSNLLAQRHASHQDLNTRQLLCVKIGLLLLYSVTCFLVALLFGISQWRLFALLVVAQSLTSLFAFLRSLLTANQLFKTDSFFSVLDKTLLLLFCIGPVYGLFFHITILHFLALQVLSILAAIITLSLLLLRKKLLTSGEKVNTKIIASWTAPFVLIILLMSAHNRLDAFLLERMHADGALQAGIYAMAYRLLDAANMVGYLTALFLVPFVARHRNDTKLVQQVLLLSRHGLLLLSAAAVAFVIVFAPWLLDVLYHTFSSQSITVIRLCMAVLPAYFLTHIYGSALTATAHFKPFIRILIFAVLTNVLLNLWLIPKLGAEGCCMAALISQYGCGIALWFSASRKLNIASGKSSAVLYPAAAVFCGALLYLAQKLTGNVWIILSSIALLGFVLMLTQRSLLKKLILSL